MRLVATGLFGVSEASLRRAPVIEIKYAQRAKPGLGRHLLAMAAGGLLEILGLRSVGELRGRSDLLV